jgi:hypothetical protein
MAKGVSRRFFTSAARVLSRARPCGIFGDSVAEFFQEFWFSLPNCHSTDCFTLIYNPGLVQ